MLHGASPIKRSITKVGMLKMATIGVSRCVTGVVRSNNAIVTTKRRYRAVNAATAARITLGALILTISTLTKNASLSHIS